MSYNNKVLTGNWAEERLQNNFNSMMFLRRREQRTLLLQKARTLFSNSLKEVTIGSGATYVSYGNYVQVIATDMPINNKAATAADFGLALSSLVLPRQVDLRQNMSDGCLMTLSPIKKACVRNTFTVCGNDESLNGENLNYGDEFFLKANNPDPEAPPLYVSYTPNPIPEPRDRMPIHLSRTLDRNCRWLALPLHGRERPEKMGFPVKSHARIIVVNSITGRPLFVMNQNWIRTFFGPECGVTCHRALDQLSRNMAENAFTMIVDDSQT